ncbi:MAG TPA: peptide chain release factor 1, partial [archaeon]|nr:peptide chain release factor 1 [archaeon]
KPHGRGVYGINEVIKRTENGAVDRIVVSEGCQLHVYELLNTQTEEKKTVFSTTKPSEPGFSIMGDEDAFDFLEKLAENYGSTVITVSTDTREGQQFAELGGIGAFLRYV